MEKSILKAAKAKAWRLTPLAVAISLGSPVILNAAPAVTGTNGCIISNGSATQYGETEWASGGDGQYTKWYAKTCGAVGQAGSGLPVSNYVSANEVNNAFQQIQNEYQEYVNTIINNNDNSEQADKDLSQDTRLDDTDKQISDIKKNGVFYNTDADGNKTGGLTLNDGTGNPVQIGNVAAGKTSTDAVNVSQLDATVNALGGGAKINADGTIQAPTYEVAGLKYNNVGDALKATYDSGVQYVTDSNGKRTNDVALTGDGTGPVTIHNVADGKSDTDAANVRQVKQATQDAKSYTDQRVNEMLSQNGNQISELSGKIEGNQREARGGIAAAMGMAALRFDNNPGKLSFASGVGNFKGSTSFVAGMGYTSEDGLVRVNASMGYNFGEDDLSWNAGASFTLN